MSVNNDSFNKGGFYAFLFSMVFSIGLILVLSFVYKGVQIDDLKEKVKAESDQTLAKAFDPAKVTEPWVTSPEFVEYGKSVFDVSCSTCHGKTGAGDGVAAAALNPKPRNLIVGEWKAGGTSAELFATIKNGLPGTAMAPFGALEKVDRWAIVHYIRSITKNKPEDDSAKLADFGKASE